MHVDSAGGGRPRLWKESDYATMVDAPQAGDLERLVLSDPDMLKAVDAAAKLAGVPILEYVGAFLKKALRLHLLPVVEPVPTTSTT